jgi:hypothetical protein
VAGAVTQRVKVVVRADAKAMTLDELGAFVQLALRSGASGDVTPRVKLNWGGTIKEIEVETGE